MHPHAVQIAATSRALQAASMALVLAAVLGALMYEIAYREPVARASPGPVIERSGAIPGVQLAERPWGGCRIADLAHPTQSARVSCQPWRAQPVQWNAIALGR